MILQYNECKSLIKEADVLLFKSCKFPGIGWWIGCYTQSPYSHVGLAHRDGENLYCLEFREFKGARQYLIEDYLNEGQKIDVFRAYQLVRVPTLSGYVERRFSDTVAEYICKDALKFIEKHQRYGWKIIWKIVRTYIPFVRWFRRVEYNDSNGNVYVCSTLITKLYRKYYIDPVPFLADDYTKPGDLARATLFEYLFSIDP